MCLINLRMMKNIFKELIAFVCMSAGASQTLKAQANVLTYYNDLARTGANANEMVLTPSNVNSASFGKLFAHTLDGYVYGQPLYMASVPINGTRHNAVFVATEGDSVYAFDADNASGPNASPLWKIGFSDGQTIIPVPADMNGGPNDVFGCLAVNPEIGITGTPVIDPSSMTLYAVTVTKEIAGNSVNYLHRLRAIDITTGLERPGSGMAISAPPGVAYNPQYMLQRTGLLLLSGKIYIGFSSTCDRRPYNGMMVTFDASTLKQTAITLVPSPGDAGGIWGGAPSVDSTGNIFVAIGNGNFDGITSFACALLKLNSQLQVTDYFSSADVNDLLNPDDLDLGSGMAVILPDSVGSAAHPHLILIGGKERYLYLVDRDNMEKWEPISNTLLPTPPQYAGGPMFGRGVFFNGNYFISPGYSSIKSFEISNAQMSLAGQTTASYGPWAGSSLSLSANGTSNGILWVLSANGDGYSAGSSAVLDAYDPTNLQNLLYTSNNSSDTLGGGVRWASPTVVQGRVYATAAASSIGGTIATFGLKSPTCAADVSSEVTVSRGGWHYNRAGNNYSETLTLTNTGAHPVGPVSVVLDSLSSFAGLSSATGTTTCGALTGSPYQNVSLANNSLSPGQSAIVNIVATNSTPQTIGFNTRVLAGSGIR
jgi:hypothetical protein